MYIKEEYSNAVFYGDLEKNGMNGIEYWVALNLKNSTTRIFTEITRISRTAIRMIYNDKSREEVIKIVSKETFSKAKARYTLKLYDEGKDYIQDIDSNTIQDDTNQISDKEVRDFLLTALMNIRKNKPQSFREERIIVKGFCGLLGITDERYQYNASILLEDGYIEEGPGRMHIGDGGVYITSPGVSYLEEKKSVPRKPKISTTNDDGHNSSSDSREFKYDVAISFAGEDRNIAEQIATELRNRNVEVFYDNFEVENLWGKNLYEYLSHIYTNAAKYCVLLLSESYAKKSWTTLERRSAQARAFREKNEYILPIRLDGTEIPGLLETIGYLSLDKNNPTKEKINKIVDSIIKKLEKFNEYG